MGIGILYVDHEINNLNSFMATFRKDAKIFLSETTSEGFEVLDKDEIDIVFADHEMPHITGLEFFEQVSNRFPETIRVLLTCHAYKEEFKNAIKTGYMHHYVNKPWDEEELRSLINLCMVSKGQNRRK